LTQLDIATILSYMTYSAEKNHLYPLQDKILAKVYAHQNDWGIPGVILCGGTALARCYLKHRISYDLDFFVPRHFSVQRFLQKSGKDGLILDDISIEDGDKYVTQVHAYTIINKEQIKLSFVQDVFDGMWNTVDINNIRTEEIQGLYHRKLRTVTGSGHGDQTQGARQNARDLFDLYALHKSVEPLSEFIKKGNQHGVNLPVAPFCANIIAMPWLELMEEFDRLVISDEYSNISFFREIRNTLVDEAIVLQKEGV